MTRAAARETAPHAAPPPIGSSARLHTGLLICLLALALIAGRLVWLQTVRADAYAGAASQQRTSTVQLPARRGALLDRNGEVLAMSVDAHAVYGEPRVIAQAECGGDSAGPCQPADIAQALAPALGVPMEQLVTRLALTPKEPQAVCSTARLEGCRGFTYLARGLDDDAAARIRALALPGVGTVVEPRRVAPSGDVAANVLGFTSVEGAGAAGAELQFDALLAGTPGTRVAEVDGEGRVLPNGRSRAEEAVPGRDVRLSIDRDIQWRVQQVLAAAVDQHDAESASATLLDTSTGEVLALASVPTFDANEPGRADASRRGNAALTDVFEPGSIGKAITAAAVLEAGALHPDSLLTVPDRHRLADKVFKDAHDHPTEVMTFTEVLVESSNVGTIKAAQRIGGARLHEMLTRFGIGARTGIELPGESPGILRDETDEWSGTDYGTHPIGQGYAVNGLQMASVYATIANDGIRVPPTILARTADGDEGPGSRARSEGTRVLSARVAAQLSLMLEGVTGDSGTAAGAAVPGYRVAGKTGTAQRASGAGGYDDGYTASFTGFAPADEPRLALSVSIHGPTDGYYGGAVAGPVFSEIMGDALAGMRVAPTGSSAPHLRLRAYGR